MPHALLFWQGTMSWVGGLGILLLVISVLPAFEIGTANLANAETMIGGIEKYRQRVSKTAKTVYTTYILLTIAAFLLLLPSGIGVFNSFTASFTSISNCGMSDFSTGIRFFDSFYVEIVIVVFCILGSTNFTALRLIRFGRFKDFFSNPEIRMYLLILLITFTLVTLVLWLSGTYESLGKTIKDSLLQIVAFNTTAGFTVTDYSRWPTFCKLLLMFIGFIGGCSASTAGGLKVSRFLVVLMLIRRNFYKRLHPNAVVAVRIGNQVIQSDKVSNINVTAILYFFIFACGSILLSLDGFDIETSVSAVISTLSNTGTGFGMLAHGHTYEIFSYGGKLLLSMFMLIGRLEIFAVLLLFTPSFWKKNN